MSAASALLRVTARCVPSGLVGRRTRPVAVGFHGVVRRYVDRRIEINHQDVDAFVGVMRSIKAHFDVLPMAALAEVLKAPARHRRALFLTADDGYRNTLTVAADILDELRLPWTLFVSTHHIETGNPNPLFLARLFLHFAPAGRYVLPHFPGVIELRGRRERVPARVLKHLKSLEVAKADDAIRAMVNALPPGALGEHTARFDSERFLTWPEVRTLASRGVTIGSHACTHWPMNAMQLEEYIVDQAHRSREEVRRAAGECRVFAYPFGNTNDVAAAAWLAVRDAGYDHAFTTVSASLDGSTNPWLLPRYMLRSAEANLPAVLSMLHAGAGRLKRWQQSLAREDR